MTTARDALVNALDELEEALADLEGEPERVDVVVVYSLGRETDDGWHEVGGWSCTPGPKWAHAALLRRAADAHDDAARSVDDDDEVDE